MTPLQQVLNKLDQLTPKEQWQVMGHLMNQLQSQPAVETKPQYESDEVAEIEKILRETEGSWGGLGLDEIDAQLARQRQFDWGE